MSERRLHILMDNLGIGGQQMYYWHVARYMRDQGWALSTSYAEDQGDETPWRERWESMGPCIPLKGAGSLRHRSDFVPNARNVATLVSRFRRERPDVMLSGGSWTRGLGSAVSKLSGVPLTNLPGSIWIHRRAYRELAKWTGPVHSCEGYISLSAVSEREFLDLSVEPRRIIHSHHGTDLERFQPRPEVRARVRAELGLDDDTLLLGFAGRLDPTFGLPEIVDMLAGTERWRLLIIGDGPARAPVEARIEALGLHDRVTLTGFVDDPSDLICAMDCAVIFATIPHGGRFNIGTFTIEALATGVPVLHFVPPEICGGYVEGISGHYVGNEPELIRERLLELEAEPTRLVKMGRAAREHAEAHFDRDDGLARIAEAYERLATGRWPDGTPRRPGGVPFLRARHG